MTIDPLQPLATHLHSIEGGATIDVAAAARAVTDLLVALGQDPADPHLADTPRRVAASFRELLTPARSTSPPSPTTRPTTSSFSPAPSRSTPCAATTCCRSEGSPTWGTCPAT